MTSVKASLTANPTVPVVTSVVIVGSCKRHNPTYGCVYIDGKEHDICDVVKSLSPEKKEKIDKHDTYRSLSQYNGRIYLNNILLTDEELSFSRPRVIPEISTNDFLIERRYFELGERQKEARQRQKETTKRQKKSAMKLIEDNVNATERFRDALECQRKDSMWTARRRQEIAENQRETIMKMAEKTKIQKCTRILSDDTFIL